MNNGKPIVIAQIMGKWLGGGVEAVVMNYYRHIDRKKIQFDFICDSDSTNIPYDEIKKLGGKVILIPPYQKIFKYHKELKRVLKEGNYKIVHSHINTLSVFSLFAAWCAKIPVRIAHSHSTTNKKEKKKNLLKQVLRPFVKIVATDYMACTEHAGRWLFGDKSFDKGKVFILNNAIDLERFKFNNKIRFEIRKKLNIKDSTYVIGHVGRFVEQKNHRFIIEVFNEYYKQNKDSKLMLIGQGPLMQEMKDLVDCYDLNENVIFLGQKDDANEYYNAMDLFLFPSLYEGLGMVMIEAQANGLPCLASTEIPKVTELLDNVMYLNLDVPIKKWGESASKLLKKPIRKSLNDYNFTDFGYDIDIENKKLTNKYMMLYNLNSLNASDILSNAECKKIQMSILAEIDSYCMKNDIRYSLGYGSLLGAIRHKGFIPWDDDIDIIMPRKDYDRFKKNYLSKNYKIITSNDYGYYYPFMKLVDQSTYVKMADNTTIHGLWIDIFPIDNVPDNYFVRKIYLYRNYLLRTLLISGTTDFSNNVSIKKRTLKKLLKIICNLIGKKRLVMHYEKLNKKFSNKNTLYSSCLSTPYTFKELYKNDCLFENLKKYVFENSRFSGIEDYDSYLKMLYNNYMELPPKSKRRTHRIEVWKVEE